MYCGFQADVGIGSCGRKKTFSFLRTLLETVSLTHANKKPRAGGGELWTEEMEREGDYLECVQVGP